MNANCLHWYVLLINNIRHETNGYDDNQSKPEACSAHNLDCQVILLRCKFNDRVDQTERHVDSKTGPSEEVIDPRPVSDLQRNLESDHEHDARDGQNTEVEPADCTTVAVQQTIGHCNLGQKENNQRVEDTFANECDELLNGELETCVNRILEY